MIYVLIFLIFIFSTPYSHAAERLLDSLSDSDMHATGKHSPYYSREVKEMFPRMYAEGDTMETGDFLFIFLGGLYQHYVHQLTGFDPEYNYEMFQKDGCFFKIYDEEKFKAILKARGEGASKLTKGQLFTKVIPYVRWIKRTLESLKSNKIFANLGGDFQRDRVIVEKKRTALEGITDESEKKELFKELMAVDRRATDRQTLLFHWIKDVFGKSKEHYTSLVAVEPNQERDEALIASLGTTYRPEFLDWERYAPLLRH